MILRTLAILLSLVLLPLPQTQANDGLAQITNVRLRSTVRLDYATKTILLSDLAKISGPQTDALETLEIKTDTNIVAGKWSNLDLSAIRKQIKDAADVNDGAIVIHGGNIQLTRLRDPAELASNVEPDKVQSSLDNPTQPILKQRIEQWVYQRLRSTPTSTRIKFEDRDEELLLTPTKDRLVHIRELGRSDLMALGIVIYEGERIVLEKTLRFEALVQRKVMVSTTQIPRKSAISDENVTIEERWLPMTEPIAAIEESMGQIARSTIDPGSMVMTSMLEPPIMVKRGDLVSARSIAGQIVVTLQVRAKNSGCLGEIIELESLNRKQQFSARVAGHGRVVIIHDSQRTSN